MQTLKHLLQNIILQSNNTSNNNKYIIAIFQNNDIKVI